MKKIHCLSGIVAFVCLVAGCTNMNSPSSPIDNVITTVGDAFGNISGHKSGKP